MTTSYPAPTQDPRRLLPSVDHLLTVAAGRELVSLYGRERVRVQAQREIELLRQEIAAGAHSREEVETAIADLPRRIGARLDASLGAPLARVINATGIFLHTNLGRAPLPPQVARALPALCEAACNLEFDLESGRRSQRGRRAEALLSAVTAVTAGAAATAAAEDTDALIVNNNAAALTLALAALAATPRRQEAIVSRGELVEIGGSFRVPEILRAAGARLVEVGTTNRTRLADYAAAIGPETGLLLKVYPSNYRMRGFVESVEAPALAELAHRHGTPLLVDEGSGLLRPPRQMAPQLREHPAMSALLAAGCDLVCGSGDKLAGGPQAGLLVGRAEYVERCRRHPLYRALRPGRLTLAALEGVLEMHLADKPLPLDRMWPEPQEHRARLAAAVARLQPLVAEIVPAEAFLGGGAAPDEPLPGEALAIPGDEEHARRLRLGDPSVVGYIREGKLILDLRTVDPGDDEALVRAVLRAARRN